MTRVYISDIRRAWPVSRQEALLDAKLPGWRDGAVYRDHVTARQREAHSPKSLIERDRVTAKTQRRTGETVHVAALPVLAWTPRDLLAVLAALSARRATLVSLDCGTTVPPNDAEAIVAAAAEFDRAIRRAGDARKTGGMVSGEVRSVEAQAKCATIKERWGLPNSEWTTTALCEEAGVSKPTALKWLGKREEAQRLYKIRQETAARNRSRGKPHEPE